MGKKIISYPAIFEKEGKGIANSINKTIKL